MTRRFREGFYSDLLVECEEAVLKEYDIEELDFLSYSEKRETVYYIVEKTVNERFSKFTNKSSPEEIRDICEDITNILFTTFSEKER